MDFVHVTDQASVFIVDMRGQYAIFSELAERGIEKFINQWKNIAVVVQRTWYASWLVCLECWTIPQCDNCDIAVAWHTHPTNPESMLGLCHICKREYKRTWTCDKCSSSELQTYGVWAQQVEEKLWQLWVQNCVTLHWSSVWSLPKSAKLQEQLTTTQCVIWTASHIQWLTSRTPDLIIWQQADSALHSPDFQSAWQTYIALSSMNRTFSDATHIYQCFNPQHYAVINAAAWKEQKMRDDELAYRKPLLYPPFGQLCVLQYKHEIEASMFTKVNTLYQDLLYAQKQYEFDAIKIYTTPPSVYKMYGKYRYSIIMKWKNLREFLDIVYSKLRIQEQGFSVDWEPEHLV